MIMMMMVMFEQNSSEFCKHYEYIALLGLLKSLSHNFCYFPYL